MESAPNTQKILNLLKSKGHQFYSQKSVLQSCKDGKFLLTLLKDLTQNFEMGFMRSWMATENNSYSSDLQRCRVSYPPICNFLIINELAQLFGGRLSLSMLSKLSKDSGQLTWQLLGKLTNFTQIKKKIWQKSEEYRTQFELIKASFKKANQNFLEAEKRKKELIALKEKEKSSFEEKMKIFQQQERIVSQKTKMVSQLSRGNSLLNEYHVSDQARQTQFKRNIEQLTIKIAQYKRQLSRISPDIRKRREHTQVRIQGIENRRIFNHNLGKVFRQACEAGLQQTKINSNNITDRANQLMQCQKIIKEQQKANEQLQIEITKLQPQIDSCEQQNKKENLNVQKLNQRHNQIVNQISVLQNKQKEQENSIKNGQGQNNQLKKILEDLQQCRRKFEQQKRKLELESLAFYEEQNESQKQTQKQLQEWEASFIKSLAQFSKPFDSIADQ